MNHALTQSVTSEIYKRFSDERNIRHCFTKFSVLHTLFLLLTAEDIDEIFL